MFVICESLLKKVSYILKQKERTKTLYKCKKCSSFESSIIEPRFIKLKRPYFNQFVRRRRKCKKCDYTFSTIEIPESDVDKEIGCLLFSNDVHRKTIKKIKKIAKIIMELENG